MLTLLTALQGLMLPFLCLSQGVIVFLQPLSHAVEGFNQGTQLILTAYGNGHIQITIGYPMQRLG